MSESLRKLFDPIDVGRMRLKNRLVMCPMGTGFANRDGTINERTIAYYAERARGGAGLVIVEGATVESRLGTVGLFPRIIIDHDRFIPGLSKLVKVVHGHGARIAIQLQHGGLWAQCPAGQQPVSASTNIIRSGLESRELNLDEIREIVLAFGEAARRARDAGFDAVEINGGVGLLIAQFLSPATNHRKDAYGGDFEGRMRFLLEIIQSTRTRVGEDFPIIFDHPADEFTAGGIDKETGKLIARGVESAGVDAFRIHTGVHDPRYMHWIIPPAAVPPAFQVPYAIETKKVVSRAKVMVGRLLDDLTVANGVLEQGAADLIVLGRSLIADPELPGKAAAGKLNDIRRCIHCNQCFYRPDPTKWFVSCAVNPAAGRESEFEIQPAVARKRVMVVGGGPAGMEAALVAAVRGHTVLLYEQHEKLGGQLNIASKPPHKNSLNEVVRYYTGQLSRYGVVVKTGIRASKKLVESGTPDALVIATGAQPRRPAIKGANSSNAVTAWDVLAETVPTGSRVVVVGGGYVGCETAEFLATRGRTITVVEELAEPAPEMERISRGLLLERLAKLGVIIVTGHKVLAVKPKGIVAVKDGKEIAFEGDTVVFAVGSAPDERLNELKNARVSEIHIIGDCSDPGNIQKAIYQGTVVARRI